MQTMFDLHQKLLNQHYDRLQEWSKHLLTMSAGILGLWAGLQANLPVPAASLYLAPKLVWGLMALSLCAGVWQQWAAAEAPLRALRKAEQMLQARPPQAQDAAQPAEPLLLRQPPGRGQRIALHLQIGCFLGSFLTLTVVMMLR